MGIRVSRLSQERHKEQEESNRAVMNDSSRELAEQGAKRKECVMTMGDCDDNEVLPASLLYSRN
jgi:hypothetical protein